MARELHWCSCYDSNFKRPYFPAYLCPTFSHKVDLEKQQSDDTKDSRIVSAEEFSQEENEETSDESQETPPTTGRRRRATYKRWQLDILEDAFEANCYPSTMLKRYLAARLDMENIQVQVWFQNRRARMKRDGSENESPHGRSYPPTTRYYETQRGSLMSRPSPYTYFPRSPVGTPMFSGYDSHRVLRHSHPGYRFCSPRGRDACDVTVSEYRMRGNEGH